MNVKPEVRKQQMDTAVKLAARGYNAATISKKIKVHKETLNRWLRKGQADPDSDYGVFYLEYQHAKGQQEGNLIDRLYEGVEDHDMNAIRFAATHLLGWGDSAMQERILENILEYLAQKLDEGTFQEIVEDIANGVLDD